MLCFACAGVQHFQLFYRHRWNKMVRTVTWLETSSFLLLHNRVPGGRLSWVQVPVPNVRVSDHDWRGLSLYHEHLQLPHAEKREDGKGQRAEPWSHGGPGRDETHPRGRDRTSRARGWKWSLERSMSRGRRKPKLMQLLTTALSQARFPSSTADIFYRMSQIHVPFHYTNITSWYIRVNSWWHQSGDIKPLQKKRARQDKVLERAPRTVENIEEICMSRQHLLVSCNNLRKLQWRPAPLLVSPVVSSDINRKSTIDLL